MSLPLTAPGRATATTAVVRFVSNWPATCSPVTKCDAARTQLLIAAGNAPDDPAIKTEIAGQLEQANDPQDALGIYRSVAARHSPPLAAVEGAGRTAFNLGEYRIAADYLARTVCQCCLCRVARQRKSCRSRHARHRQPHPPALSVSQSAAAPASPAHSGRKKYGTPAAHCLHQPPVSPLPPPLSALVARWEQLPSRLTAVQLEQNPDLEQTLLQLVYDTETVTAQALRRSGPLTMLCCCASLTTPTRWISHDPRSSARITPSTPSPCPRPRHARRWNARAHRPGRHHRTHRPHPR